MGQRERRRDPGKQERNRKGASMLFQVAKQILAHLFGGYVQCDDVAAQGWTTRV
jgi:hypothetical protein